MMVTTPTLVVMIVGIFVSTAFFIITFVLRSKKLGIGYWPLFGFSIFFLTFGEFVRSLYDDPFAFQYFFLISMILFGFAGLLKFWDIMRLIE